MQYVLLCPSIRKPFLHKKVHVDPGMFPEHRGTFDVTKSTMSGWHSCWLRRKVRTCFLSTFLEIFLFFRNAKRCCERCIISSSDSLRILLIASSLPARRLWRNAICSVGDVIASNSPKSSIFRRTSSSGTHLARSLNFQKHSPFLQWHILNVRFWFWYLYPEKHFKSHRSPKTK